MTRIYPPERSRSIRSSDGRVDEFATFFAGLRQRWVKVERLQAYDEPDSAGYRAFQDGDYAAADRLARERVKAQTFVYDHARKHNVSMIRIRICDLPLSPYLLHYELACYEADIECGEDIRFIDSRQIADLLASTEISDYVLFDEDRVTALIYDEAAGRMLDVFLSEDRDVVRAYVDLSDQLISLSTPMLESAIYKDVKTAIARQR